MVNDGLKNTAIHGFPPGPYCDYIGEEKVWHSLTNIDLALTVC